MHDLTATAAARNRRTGVLVAGALWFPVVAGLITARLALADGAGEPDTIRSAPEQPQPRSQSELDDGFKPLSKVVPQAKIILHEKQRLPDRGGEKTFAAYGRRSDVDILHAGQPLVPMYAFAYHPLYFEDINLERCGRTCGLCLQPVLSGVHFFGTVAILPYKMLVSPPCSYVCPPGECPPGGHIGCFENFIGPAPDFGKLSECAKFFRREKCE
jgi:hypothetical protein